RHPRRLNQTSNMTPESPVMLTSPSSLGGLMKKLLSIVLLALAVVVATPDIAYAATPPAQPASGPGGAGYPWSGYVYRVRSFANYDLNYATYEPAGWVGGGTAPTTAKIVVFNHGYTYNTTPYYQEWLRYNVRKGNVVNF